MWSKKLALKSILFRPGVLCAPAPKPATVCGDQQGWQVETTSLQSASSSYSVDGTDILLGQRLVGDIYTGILERTRILGQGSMSLGSGLPLRGLISSKEYRNIFGAALSS